MCFLVTLGMLGCGEVAIAFFTFQEVPMAVTILLGICAGVQVLCCVTGICGFKRFSRECLCCSMFILTFSAAGLGYVAVASYLWLRDTTPKRTRSRLRTLSLDHPVDARL